MKKVWFIAILLSCTLLSAQEPSALLSRVLEANKPASLQARFTQTRHSPLLEENLKAEGLVYMQAPDKIRWECTSPVKKVSILGDPSAARRFRLPTEKDFSVSALEGEGELALVLTPLRRDLKQMMTQAIVKADPATYRVRSVLIRQADGGWMLVEFRDVKVDIPLESSLFEAQ